MTQTAYHDDGDRNTQAPGSQPAHFDQGRGDEIEPGRQPDEVGPGKGDDYQPDRSPDEVAPGQGDFDRPDSSPIESPPQPDVAPSTLAVVGRYVLTGDIFGYLENIGAGTGGEIQLTDGIAALMRDQRVLAYRYQGTRYDCGSKLGYLEAMTAMGLKHPETADGYARFLQQLGRVQ